MDRQANKQGIGEKSSQLQISGKLLARNTLLNFLGQVVPLLVGVVTIPLIVRGLGTDRFGLLSLAWVVVGYFGIFDLGLGQATTKFVAETLGKGKEEQVPQIVWTAVTIQAILGIVWGFILWEITPLLVERILNIPPELVSEARVTFYLLAFSIPINLVFISFRGVLEAYQRFDLVNAVKIPTNACTFLLPLIGIFLGFKLPGIVALILAARIGTLITFILLNLYLVPSLRRYRSSFNLFPYLFSFGGWMTISNIVGLILAYLDRFLVGSFLTMAAVAYYTAPFELITRLWIVPRSLVTVLFPAFSSLGTTRRNDLLNFYIGASKVTLLIVTPLVLIFVLFSTEILTSWLGADFARNSTIVFQILSFGVLCGSMTQIAFALFQGIGRPDIGTKIQLLLLPISALLAWVLIKKVGIVGAALSWTLSRIFGMLFSLRAAWQIVRIYSFKAVWDYILQGLVWLLTFTISMLSLLLLSNIVIKFLCALLLSLVFTIIGWRYLLSATERR